MDRWSTKSARADSILQCIFFPRVTIIHKFKGKKVLSTIEEDTPGGSNARAQGEITYGSSVTIDHNHPVYLSSLDVPGALSVGIQLTGMENPTLYKGVLSVSVYYTKLKNLWDEYDSILPPPSCDYHKAKEYVEQLPYQRLLQFLMGLNDIYSQARDQIVMMHNLPNVNQAYALVIQDENNFKGKKKANAVGRGGAQLKEDQDYAVLGGSAMHSRLRNVQFQEDMRGSGQTNAPEQ
ncbi:hypothetical protein KY290_010468 [Solanum tuberosum]|uniref:Uncharacterized protein n=1 Tax=Solanum tuberosum TaxID=4113 RepID=A0ABQ7VXU8_SOLTU|nr:hypothetical protein KY290_010468 [Solanum tuberosum]